MLNKTIHIDNTYQSTHPLDENIIFSIGSYITRDSEDTPILMVELDSLLAYAGLTVEKASELLQSSEYIQRILLNTVNISKEDINGYSKHFINYEYLNLYLLQLLNEATKNGYNILKLSQVLSNIDLSILSEWNSEANKLKKIINSLGISYKPKNSGVYEHLEDIHGFLKFFSSRY